MRQGWLGNGENGDGGLDEKGNKKKEYIFYVYNENWHFSSPDMTDNNMRSITDVEKKKLNIPHLFYLNNVGCFMGIHGLNETT